ncbi:MAG: hypothetical protein DRH15_03915 [Deltaproteobacteria bacterium]|nr:MAG: hypothetical protein DRH15_03915 [Deltaproteobacteria bacterium]
MFSIKIKYCGGCNPEIDRVWLVESLKEQLLEEALKIDFVEQEDETADLLLLINGCKHACLEQEIPDTDKQSVILSVKGEMVGDQYVKESEIAGVLVDLISKYSTADTKQ